MSNNDKLTLLAVGAHPSDLVANLGGTLAKHARRGDNVVLLSLTYGVEVHTEAHIGKSEAEIKEIVRQQSVAAINVLGIPDIRILDFGDTPLVATRENMLALADVIQEVRPDILISAHYPFNADQWGRDHHTAARMVQDAPAWRVHAGKERYMPTSIWYACTDYLHLQHVSHSLPTHFVDITETMDDKIQACIVTWGLGAEDGGSFAEAMRASSRHFGGAVGVKYAEGFECPRRPAKLDYLTP